VNEVQRQLQAAAHKEATSDVVTKSASGVPVTVPRPMITALSSMRTAERLEALLPTCVKCEFWMLGSFVGAGFCANASMLGVVPCT
jgi:hypothetical protein